MIEPKLPDIQSDSISSVEILYSNVEFLRDSLEEYMQVLLAGSSISTLSLTASVSYTASELQSVSDKVDTIIIALKTAGIINE